MSRRVGGWGLAYCRSRWCGRRRHGLHKCDNSCSWHKYDTASSALRPYLRFQSSCSVALYWVAVVAAPTLPAIHCCFGRGRVHRRVLHFVHSVRGPAAAAWASCSSWAVERGANTLPVRRCSRSGAAPEVPQFGVVAMRSLR